MTEQRTANRLAEAQAKDEAERHAAEVEHLQAVRQATGDVRAAVQGLADETSRAQRLALWVAIGTILVGAVVGGFAGAVAARLIGS